MEAERQGKFSEAYNHFSYYTQQDFIALGTALGLNAKIILACIDGIEKKLPEVHQLIESAMIPGGYKAELLGSLEGRMRAVKAQL